MPADSSRAFRVLLADALDSESEHRLETGANVVRAAAADEDALCRLIGDCDALVARTHTSVTRRVLEAGRRLRVVGVAGVGTDRVDMEAAEQCGIAVLSTPAAASDAVAEFTVALMLQLLRPIPRLTAEYKAGRYKPARAAAHGSELREHTIGILGLGRIGSRVARICAVGVGARVLYNDIRDLAPLPIDAQAVDKSALWRESDILTLHVPLTEQTRGLISASVFEQLRPTALLINTARGEVVDTEALTATLRTGRLGGAGLDVTHPEPLSPDHPLFSMPNCILTPHVAARTFGGLQRMCAVVDDVLRFLHDHSNDPPARS